MAYKRICVDTGILIRFLRGEDPAASALEKCIAKAIAISPQSMRMNCFTDWLDPSDQ